MAATTEQFTLLAEFKEYLAVKKPTALKDTILNVFLDAAATAIFEHLQQKIIVKEYTETFDVVAGKRKFAVPAAPIHSITSLKSDRDREFSSATALELTEFDGETDRDIGFITIDGYTPSIGPGALQIVWVGGFAFDRDVYIARQNDPEPAPSNGDIYLVGDTPTGLWSSNPNQLATWDGAAWQFKTAYSQMRVTHPDILLACYMQAAVWWRTRHLQGTQQATFKNASLMVRSLGFINPVWEIIRAKRRVATKDN
jgi:hypothetical protein